MHPFGKVPEYLRELIIDSEEIPLLSGGNRRKTAVFCHEDFLLMMGVMHIILVSEDNLEAFIREHEALVSGQILRFLNGGSDVVVGIKKRNQHYRLLVDISRISSLQKISYRDNQLTIGGGVTLSGNY